MAELVDPQPQASTEIVRVVGGEQAGERHTPMVVEMVLIVILVGVVVVVILAILGPTVGNIFSNTIMGSV